LHKVLKKLVTKKGRRELGLCIVEGQKIVDEHRAKAVHIFERGKNIDAKLFDEVSSLETSQGIMAIVPIPAPTEITWPFLVLDGVQDPGNMGTLLRTAAAFGFKTIFSINSADVWSQKVLRAAVGTQFSLNIYELNHDEFKTISETQLKAGELYIADLGGTWQDKPEGKFGLVLGSEGQGVSQQIKQLTHKVITIKMKTGVESLNVAVAGGIIMHGWTQ